MGKYKRRTTNRSRVCSNRTNYKRCYSKKGYTTTHDANHMIHHQAKKFGIKCHYYRCPLCNRYHLTKSEKYDLTP